jgi:hypothetical protein
VFVFSTLDNLAAKGWENLAVEVNGWLVDL